MTFREKNLAYDLSLFEENNQEKNKKDNILEIPQNKVVKSQKIGRLALLLIITAFSLSTIIVGLIVYNQVLLTEYTDKIHKASMQLSESKSLNTQLKMKVEAKLSPSIVEKYATEKLSMEKNNCCQVNYISLSTDDKAEEVDAKNNGILSRIFSLWE